MKDTSMACCLDVITGQNSLGIQRMLLRQYIIPYVQMVPFSITMCILLGGRDDSFVSLGQCITQEVKSNLPTVLMM